MNRRRLLKYAGAGVVIVGASALGLGWLVTPKYQPTQLTNSTTSASATISQTVTGPSTTETPPTSSTLTNLTIKLFKDDWRGNGADDFQPYSLPSKDALVLSGVDNNYQQEEMPDGSGNYDSKNVELGGNFTVSLKSNDYRYIAFSKRKFVDAANFQIKVDSVNLKLIGGEMNGFLTLPLPNSVAIDVWNYVDLSSLSNNQFRDWQGGSTTYKGHTGIDFGGPPPNGLPVDTPIYAAAPGVILSAEDNWRTSGKRNLFEGGNRVIIDHFLGKESGYRTAYLHLSGIAVKYRELQFPIDNTQPDLQFVERGELIGYSGNTGFNTGDPHLHFEVNKYPPNADNEDSFANNIPGVAWYGDAGGVIIDPFRDLFPNSPLGANLASDSVSLWTKDNDPRLST